MSLIFFPMSIGFMSHVGFKKWPCRPDEFKGQGPHPHHPPPPPTVLGRSSPMLTRVTMVTKRALSQHCNKTTTWGPEGQRSRGPHWPRAEITLSKQIWGSSHTYDIKLAPNASHLSPSAPEWTWLDGLWIWIRVSMDYYKSYFKYLHRHCPVIQLYLRPYICPTVKSLFFLWPSTNIAWLLIWSYFL